MIYEVKVFGTVVDRVGTLKQAEEIFAKSRGSAEIIEYVSYDKKYVKKSKVSRFSMKEILG